MEESVALLTNCEKKREEEGEEEKKEEKKEKEKEEEEEEVKMKCGGFEHISVKVSSLTCLDWKEFL